MGRETGKDKISMKAERMTSRGRFKKGSLAMGASIEYALTANNYSTRKHEKLKNRFKKQAGSNNNELGVTFSSFLRGKNHFLRGKV